MQTPTDELCTLAETALTEINAGKFTRGTALLAIKRVLTEFFETYDPIPMPNKTAKTVATTRLTGTTSPAMSKSSSDVKQKKSSWANVHKRKEIGLTSYFPDLWKQIKSENPKSDHFTIISLMRDTLEKPENAEAWQEYHDTIRELHPEFGLPDICPARNQKQASPVTPLLSDRNGSQTVPQVGEQVEHSVKSNPKSVQLSPMSDSTPQIIYLTSPDSRGEQSWVFYFPGYLPSTPDTFAEILSEKPAEQHVIKMFGESRTLPRFNQAYGNAYKYSGAVSEARPWTPITSTIRDKLSEDLKSYLPETPLNFNMALVNWYMIPSHYISPHSDDTRQLIPNSPVATLSWGSSRNFVLEPKKGIDGQTVVLQVNDGDLLIMGGTTQNTHKHSVPKAKGGTQPRISFTYRIFK